MKGSKPRRNDNERHPGRKTRNSMGRKRNNIHDAQWFEQVGQYDRVKGQVYNIYARFNVDDIQDGVMVTDQEALMKANAWMLQNQPDLYYTFHHMEYEMNMLEFMDVKEKIRKGKGDEKDKGVLEYLREWLLEHRQLYEDVCIHMNVHDPYPETPLMDDTE